MRKFSKERLDEMDDYQSIRDKRLSKAEQHQISRDVELELIALKSMQESLSQQVASFMTSKEIGIVKLTEILQSSTRQTTKIMNAEANVTLATIASLAQVMGKKVKIIFE